MSIRTTIVGSYPKVTESGSDNLPGTIDRWQRKLVGDEVLEQEVQKVIRRVLQEQQQAGLDLVTDGQIRWEDLPHPITRSVKGLDRGALRRFFDNNVYYRRLEFNGNVEWQKASVAEEFHFATQNSQKPVKVSLPGPLTLVSSTELKKGQSRESALALYTNLVRKEVEALTAAGVNQIQLEEPAFQVGEPLLAEAIEAIHQIFKGVKAHKWVAFYFHDISPIWSDVTRLQVDVLGLDLISGPKVADLLKDKKWPGEIALGLVDARNTKLESVSELKRQVAEFAKVIPPDRLWLSTSCGLEFLPHASALKKLQLLREVAHT